MSCKNICSWCNNGNGLHHPQCPCAISTHIGRAVAPEEKETDPFGPDHQITLETLEGEYGGPINDWVDAMKQKELCGVFPFVTPAEFPLTPCCQAHDRDYTLTRSNFIQQYMADHSELDRIADWKHTIEVHNDRFYQCTLNYLNSQPFYIRPFIRPFVRAFNRLVRDCGWSVWLYGTKLAIQDLKENGMA